MNDIVYDIWMSLLKLDNENIYMERYGSAKDLFGISGRIFFPDCVSQGDHNKLIDKNIKEEAIKISEYCSKNDISVVTKTNASYPRMLGFICDPPKLLYIKGTVDNSRKCVAIVGSRNPSPYGLKCTSYFARELSDSGYVIVSGLALGIDSKAHMTALDNGGITYSVLGSGIGNIYPKQNADLAEQVAKNGALITEYGPFAKPDRWHFPERNRIISGMCHAALIVEGKENSGSLITASHSIEQGREVFCVPGNIFSENSRGVNALINDGARLVNRPDEITGYLEGLIY
jgi:DNA processing protein